MSTDTLLAALTELRDRLTQRQRAANGLLTSLKGTTGALARTNRLLADYAAQRDDDASRALMAAREAFGSSRIKDEAIDPLVPDLRREVKALTAQTAALREASAALQGEATDVVKLGRAIRVLRETKVEEPALAELLPELDRELQAAQQALGVTFGRTLRDAFGGLGIEIGGRPPRFEIGRFELSANFVSRTATLLYGKEVVVPSIPLSVEAIARAYQRETKAIMGRNEDGARWMEQFHQAWENVQRRRGVEGRANVVECYVELVLLRQPRAFRSEPSKRRFTDYSRAQFAYDLFEFADRQRRDVRGLRVAAHTATKSQADSAERAIWIVEGERPHDGRYVADIAFTRGE